MQTACSAAAAAAAAADGAAALWPVTSCIKAGAVKVVQVRYIPASGNSLIVTGFHCNVDLLTVLQLAAQLSNHDCAMFRARLYGVVHPVVTLLPVACTCGYMLAFRQVHG